MSIKAHALIIDDDSGNNRVLAELLEREGVSSTIIQNPGDLETVVDNLTECNIVFLDLEMPERDGYEVFEILAADSRFQSVPIVACTVHTNEAAQVRRTGLDGFIGKPLDPQRFPGQLERLLNGEQVWDIR